MRFLKFNGWLSHINSCWKYAKKTGPQSEMSFNLFFNLFAPAGLFIVMIGMGMNLAPSDFRRLLESPKAVVIGIVGQLVLLPALGFSLAYLLNVAPEIAIGIIILSACPGGVPSNVMVFLARGDLTLSVSLTALNSIVTAFTIPFVVMLGLSIHFATESQITINPLETIVKLSIFCILPVIIGMSIRKASPDFALKSEPVVKRTAILILLALLAAVAISQRKFLWDNIHDTWLVALSLNASAMLMAYILCQIGKVNLKEKITLIIEIGLQNGNLAMLVAVSILHDTRFATTPAIYGIISLFTAFIFSIVMSRRAGNQIGAKEEQPSQ